MMLEVVLHSVFIFTQVTPIDGVDHAPYIRPIIYAGFIKLLASPTVGIDHTNMTAPLPVCSAKLSMFGSG